MKEAVPLFLFVGFLSNFVFTGAVPSQPSVRKGQKLGVGGAEAVDITIGDHFLVSSPQLGAFP